MATIVNELTLEPRTATPPPPSEPAPSAAAFDPTASPAAQRALERLARERHERALRVWAS